MKVLVTGIKGQLGFDVANELEKRGHKAVGVDVEEMDITDGKKVSEVMQCVKPDAVIHCAAWTAVDAAEENAEKVVGVIKKYPKIKFSSEGSREYVVF